MANPVPLPDLERHQRTHKSKQHGSPLCNLVNGMHGDLGEGRTEDGSGGSKTSESLPMVKHATYRRTSLDSCSTPSPCRGAMFGAPYAPYKSLPGPSGPESPKSLRKSLLGPSGAAAPGSNKCQKQCQRNPLHKKEAVNGISVC